MRSSLTFTVLLTVFPVVALSQPAPPHPRSRKHP